MWFVQYILLQNYEVDCSIAQIKNLCLICIDRTINDNNNYVIYCTNGINIVYCTNCTVNDPKKKKLQFPLQHNVVLLQIFSLA
jgi:hypothetical protein